MEALDVARVGHCVGPCMVGPRACPCIFSFFTAPRRPSDSTGQGLGKAILLSPTPPHNSLRMFAALSAFFGAALGPGPHAQESSAPALAVRRKRPVPSGDWDGRCRRRRLAPATCKGGLLALPADVLRYRILTHALLDFSSLGVCRFVCKTLRDLLPPRLFPRSRHRWHEHCTHTRLRVTIGGCLVCGAVVQGHIGVLKWALERLFRGGASLRCFKHLVTLAAASGQLQVMKLLRKEITETDAVYYWEGVYRTALQCGQVEAAKWLLPFTRSSTIDMDCSALVRLCEGGHLHMFRWQNRRQKISEEDFRRMVGNAWYFGHLDVLRWLRQTNRALFTAKLMATDAHFFYALENGAATMVRWLHECGAEVTLGVVARIVNHDQLQLLKWARDIGAPWNHTYVLLATGCHSVACMRYLLAEGVAWPPSFFDRAIRSNGSPYMDCFPALEFARRQGVEWNDASMADVASRCWWGPLRRWILANLSNLERDITSPRSCERPEH
jgi:hypothetical protein